MTLKKISIITICLNDAAGLDKTMASLACQQFKDFECIVIDGGSNDGSIDIIKKYSAIVTYWTSEPDSGIYNAQNKGIIKSTGEYCLFLNSGDYLADENVLQKVIDDKSDADILYGDMLIEKGVGVSVTKKSPEKITLRKMLTDTIWHPVSFIQRNIFLKFGMYNEKYKIVGDYEFFLRVLMKEKVKTHYLNFTVSVFNLSGISSNPDYLKKQINERNSVQDVYFNPILLAVYRLYGKIRS